MQEPRPADHSAGPHYTGIVCCACKAPVAQPIDERTLRCQACGHSWQPGPPVLFRAA